jgi:hypothetical protein
MEQTSRICQRYVIPLPLSESAPLASDVFCFQDVADAQAGMANNLAAIKELIQSLLIIGWGFVLHGMVWVLASFRNLWFLASGSVVAAVNFIRDICKKESLVNVIPHPNPPDELCLDIVLTEKTKLLNIAFVYKPSKYPL